MKNIEVSGNTEISPVILMKLISWGRNYLQEETQVKWMQEKIREKRLLENITGWMEYIVNSFKTP